MILSRRCPGAHQKHISVTSTTLNCSSHAFEHLRLECFIHPDEASHGRGKSIQILRKGEVGAGVPQVILMYLWGHSTPVSPHAGSPPLGEKDDVVKQSKKERRSFLSLLHLFHVIINNYQMSLLTYGLHHIFNSIIIIWLGPKSQ